jgi:hypothetical protein
MDYYGENGTRHSAQTNSVVNWMAKLFRQIFSGVSTPRTGGGGGHQTWQLSNINMNEAPLSTASAFDQWTAICSTDHRQQH